MIPDAEYCVHWWEPYGISLSRLSRSSIIARSGLMLVFGILFYIAGLNEKTPNPKFTPIGAVLFGFGIGAGFAFADAFWPIKIGLTRKAFIVSDLWFFHFRETTYPFEHIEGVNIQKDARGRRVMRIILKDGSAHTVGLPGREATAVKALEHLRR